MILKYGPYSFETPPKDVGSFYSICYLGAYDPILQRLSPTDVVVDGGANVGIFSVLAAKTAAQVIAVEPHPENFEYLCRNLERNHVTNVRPVRRALSARAGAAFLSGDGERAHLALDGLPVETVRLDDVSPEPVTVLKLDVEGAEVMALVGQKSVDSLRLLTVEMDRPSLERINQDARVNLGVTGSFEQLVDYLRSRGFYLAFQNEMPSRPMRHLWERHTLVNEFKTQFYGARVVVKALILGGMNLLDSSSWTNDSFFYWLIYGSRSPWNS
jgi:FkbM family methyltransferase